MADTPVSSSAAPRSLLERQRIAHRARRLEAIRRELRGRDRREAGRKAPLAATARDLRGTPADVRR